MLTLRLYLQDITEECKYMITTICVYDKYTVIQGDTSSGKSFTVSNILKCTYGAEGYKYDISNEKPIEVLEHAASIDKYIEGQLFILDEESPIIRNTILLDKINAYFILITRQVRDYLPIHCRSIYYLNKSDPLHLTFQSEYLIYRPKDIIYPYYDFIVTEDSKSSYMFFDELSKYAHNYNKVESAEGKSKLTTKIRKLLVTNPNATFLIVYDAAAFGFQFMKLFKFLVTKNIKFTLLDWTSFEAYLYNCFFCPKINPFPEPYTYESLEQLYETLVCSTIIPLYDKSNLQCYSPEKGCNFCTEVNSCEYRHSRSQLVHSQVLNILGYDSLRQVVNKDIEESKEMI